MKTIDVTLLPGQEIRVAGPAVIRFNQGGVKQQGDAPMAFVADLTITEEEPALSPLEPSDN